jgi:hypothetical protein
MNTVVLITVAIISIIITIVTNIIKLINISMWSEQQLTRRAYFKTLIPVSTYASLSGVQISQHQEFF